VSFKHFDFSTPEQRLGGIQNIISVNDDGELVTRDVQSGPVLEKILDANAQARNEFVLDSGDRDAYGYLAARIPIVMWQNWRREWMEKYRQYWTWQTFEVMKLNSRDFSYLRTTDSRIGLPEIVRTTG